MLDIIKFIVYFTIYLLFFIYFSVWFFIWFFSIFKPLCIEALKERQIELNIKNNYDCRNCCNYYPILPLNERNINMIGEKIKEKRLVMGISCSELARRSGHPVSSIHGLESGNIHNPRFEIICDVADVLKINLYELKEAFESKVNLCHGDMERGALNDK